MLSHFLEINSNLRLPSKGNEIKRLLKSGFVPAVAYGKSKNFLISLSEKLLKSIANDPSGKCRLYKLNVNNESYFVILKDIVFDALSDKPVHVDFQIVEKGDKVLIDVPVQIINKDICIGIKRGGILSLMSYNVKCCTEVSLIPDKITLDVANFSMGHKLWSSELQLNSVKVLKNFLLLKISGKSDVVAEAPIA